MSNRAASIISGGDRRARSRCGWDQRQRGSLGFYRLGWGKDPRTYFCGINKMAWDRSPGMGRAKGEPKKVGGAWVLLTPPPAPAQPHVSASPPLPEALKFSSFFAEIFLQWSRCFDSTWRGEGSRTWHPPVGHIGREWEDLVRQAAGWCLEEQGLSLEPSRQLTIAPGAVTQHHSSPTAGAVAEGAGVVGKGLSG